MTQLAPPPISQPASVDLSRDIHELVGIFRRGWRYLAISVVVCLTMAAIYLAKTKKVYQSTARILVIQQGGRPLNVGNSDPSRVLESGDDFVPTHAAVISSPLVVGRAINLVGLNNLPSLAKQVDPVRAAILQLKVTRPDRTAKILQIVFRAWSPTEAQQMVEALTKSYEMFLTDTYQKSSGEVVALITKARDDLSKDLTELEQKYLKFHQEHPILATDASGRSLVARRLDEWDRASNDVLVRAVQVKAQLDLGRKLAAAGVGSAAILQTLNQLGGGTPDMRSLTAGGSTELSTGYLGQLVQEQQQLAEKFGPEYAKVKALQEQISRVQKRTRETKNLNDEGEVKDLLAAMEQGIQSIETMRAEFNKRFTDDREAAKQTEIDLLAEENLRGSLERNRSLFNTVVEQLKQAQFVSDFNSVSAQIIEPPSLPLKPSSPRTTLTLALALVAGCLLGSGAAFVADRMDLRIRTVENLRRVLDFPVLGQVSLVPRKDAAAGSEFGLISQHMPRSLWAESYRGLRTNLEFMKRNRRVQIILFASPNSGDGKSVSASNLSISMAQAGRKVLLMDADLRKPSQHKIHGLPNIHGLSSILSGNEVPLEKVVQGCSVENLSVMTTGPDVSNPAELLSSPWMFALVEQVRELYDIVIIDSSPLLAVTDASIMASMVDGVVLVVRTDRLRQHEAEAVREALGALGNPVFGTVINAFTTEQGKYGYGYGYGYGSPYGSQNGTTNGVLPVTIADHHSNGHASLTNN